MHCFTLGVYSKASVRSFCALMLFSGEEMLSVGNLHLLAFIRSVESLCGLKSLNNWL